MTHAAREHDVLAGPRETRSFVGYAIVIAVASSWGLWPWFLSLARRQGTLPTSVQATIVLGIVTLASAPLALRSRRAGRSARAWWGIAWLGFADAGNLLAFFHAYRLTTVPIAVLTHYLTPILVVVFASVWLGERLSRRAHVALAVSLGGLVLLLEPWAVARGSNDWLGAALGTLSAVFYASNVIVNKRLTTSFSAGELIFYHGLLSTPVLAAFAVPELSEVSWDAAGTLAVLAVGPGALGALGFVWGLGRIPASHASMLTLFEPVVAVALGTWILGDRLGPAQWLGGAAILGGALLVLSAARARLRRGVSWRST